MTVRADAKRVDSTVHLALFRLTTMSEPTTYTTSSYFETQERPLNLDGEVFKVQQFVQRMKQQGKRIVLVTVSSLVSFPPPFLVSLASARSLSVSLTRCKC